MELEAAAVWKAESNIVLIRLTFVVSLHMFFLQLKTHKITNHESKGAKHHRCHEGTLLWDTHCPFTHCKMCLVWGCHCKHWLTVLAEWGHKHEANSGENRKVSRQMMMLPRFWKEPQFLWTNKCPCVCVRFSMCCMMCSGALGGGSDHVLFCSSPAARVLIVHVCQCIAEF